MIDWSKPLRMKNGNKVIDIETQYGDFLVTVENMPYKLRYKKNGISKYKTEYDLENYDEKDR